MYFRPVAVRVRPNGHGLRLLGIGLTLAAMTGGVMATQASAASSPVVRVPPLCTTPVVLAAQGAPGDVHHAEVDRLCEAIIQAAPRANAIADKYYSASQRRRIRRVVGSVARQYVPAEQPTTRAMSGTVIPVALLGLSLDDIKDFGKKALKKVKTVVGGVIKVVPQARMAKCAIFAAVAAASGYIARQNLRTILIEAGTACFFTVLDDIYDAYGKLPKPR
jgi:hypothetical protein